MLQTIAWTGESVRLLDQTRLPTETCYVEIGDERQMWDAIKRLVVRGAPAIGVAAAFGAYLGVRHSTDVGPQEFVGRLKEVCDYLATSRPTAVNLFWALERVRRVVREVMGHATTSSPACHLTHHLREALLNECLSMLEEDRRVCRAIGQHGLKLFEEMGLLSDTPGEPVGLLTHCNAGSLATVAYGTALAASIRRSKWRQ